MKIFKIFVFLIFLAASAAAQTRPAQSPVVPPAQTAPAAQPAVAAPQPAPAELKGVPPQPKLAQPFTITFNVPLPDGVKAKELVYDAAAINAKDFSVLTSYTEQAGNTAEFTFRAVPFILGKTKFTAAWKLPDGGVIQAHSAELDIARVNTGIRSSDIVDIRKPITPVDIWFIILILTAAGLIAAAVIWWLMVRTKKAELESPTPPPDKRPSEIVARDRLAKLLASDLWDRKEYNLFYIELTDIFRAYLYSRFNIYTDPQTSAELLRAIKKSDAKNIYDEAVQFLNSADLVKFAESIPLIVDRDEDVKLLNAMIDATAVKVKVMTVGEGEDEHTA
ncbi:MAG: hypothetical protein LBI01_02500 [Elusimicrobium sp.]|jgi:hypothetical protein|nr:hypothetical protein [Elusimicrobium sp.]